MPNPRTPNKKIRFIINPVSGGENKQHFHRLLTKQLDQQSIHPEIVYSRSQEHTRELAQEAVELSFDAVVAVGGDGTINDLGSALVNTGVALGIIPMGSGNGLARSLNIPMARKAAIDVINRFSTRKIDAGRVNGTYFFNVAGVGFDAKIAHLFKNSVKRGLWNYTKLVLREFRNFKHSHYALRMDGIPYETDAFLISVCNGNQFGNNAQIAPGAMPDDGLLNAVILQKFGFFQAPKLAWQLFSGSIDKSRFVRTIPVKQLEFLHTPSSQIHLDGEPVILDKPLVFTVVPSALHVIC
jgi:YegS/Rv2252/BmrU family lipid kinase